MGSKVIKDQFLYFQWEKYKKYVKTRASVEYVLYPYYDAFS